MKSLDDIKVILREQLRCYKSLLDVLQRERASLIELDVPAMEQMTKEKDTLLLRIRLLEDERQRLVNLFRKGAPDESGHARAHSQATAEVTLKKLGEITGDQAFSDMRLMFRSLLQSIEELNGFNRLLIERSLDNIRATAGFFHGFGAGRSSNDERGTLISRKT